MKGPLVPLAASGSSGSSLLPLLLLVGLFALMYFMVIRPQSQRRKQQQQLQHSIGIGSQVLTIGGLYGTVVDVDDESITLEVAPGVTNRYAKAAIGKVLSSDTVPEPEEYEVEPAEEPEPDDVRDEVEDLEVTDTATDRPEKR